MQEFTVESEAAQRARSKIKISFAMGVVGWLLVASNLSILVFRSLPLKLFTAEWNLDLIGGLLSSSGAILVGLLVICIATLFNSKDKFISEWNRSACRVAAILAVLIVATVPLQFYWGKKALDAQNVQILSAVNNLKSVIRGIQATNSEAELRSFVATLPNAPTLPSKFDAPFEEVKRRAVENIQAQVNAGLNNIEVQQSEGLQIFLKEAMRNAVQAILMATAFSALANIDSRTSNFFTRFMRNFY